MIYHSNLLLVMFVLVSMTLYICNAQQQLLSPAAPSAASNSNTTAPASNPAPAPASNSTTTAPAPASNSTTAAPASKPVPAPSSSNSTTAAPVPSSSNSTTAAPVPASNTTTAAPAPKPAPTSKPNPVSPQVTPSPTKRYTTDPTKSPSATTKPTDAPKAKHGFFYYVGQTFKWIFIIAILGVCAFFGHKYWDQIYYFLMECLHRLRVCCEKCVDKSKEIVGRMIVRMNVARGRGSFGGGDDDGSMLDGLLMGERD